MKNIRIKSTITTHWTVLDSNGQVVNLSQYDVKVYYITGLGRSEGKNVTVSGSGVVTWVFKPADQTFQGVYHLLLSCSKDGEVKASYELRDVFRLSDAMYDYYGNITLNLVSGGAEGGDTPGGGGLIQVVYTEQDFGGEFDENCRNDTFNAHAINSLHERIQQEGASYEHETETEQTVRIGEERRTLLKSAAIEYSDKAVAQINDDDVRDMLNLFIPLP